MQRKGFSLLDIVVGIFLLGLILLVALPIVNTSYGYLHKSTERTRMIYMVESIAESLKNENLSGPIFEELDLGEEVYLGDSFIDLMGKYESKITMIDEDDYLRTIKIILKHKNGEVDTKDVEIQASYPKK